MAGGTAPPLALLVPPAAKCERQHEPPTLHLGLCNGELKLESRGEQELVIFVLRGQLLRPRFGNGCGRPRPPSRLLG